MISKIIMIAALVAASAMAIKLIIDLKRDVGEIRKEDVPDIVGGIIQITLLFGGFYWFMILMWTFFVCP
ncbi:MAG: hypothetical protein ABIM30_00395 [candidate division WOR-3 bacterium]